MNAFHEVTRRGFRLEDVGNAPLAKRRKLKRSLSRSSSSDSSRSSISHGSLTPTKHLTLSPMRNSPVRNLSNASTNSQNSNASQGFTPLKRSAGNPESASGYFSFHGSRIAALTPTMSPLTESQHHHGGDVEVAKTGVGGTLTLPSKRKLDLSVQEIEDESDDDDCVITHEEPAPPLMGGSGNFHGKSPNGDANSKDGSGGDSPMRGDSPDNCSEGSSSSSQGPAKRNSDAVNNNTSQALRPRSDTIVIE